ncbi:hypothetical protein [Salinispora arenicola]|uniref:hypothetical protein n=1 Tax=Salinispora arenicola TaxID=168697 RepID=UPI00207AC9D1|nr:hypothetical protein [Salinispora arenicola]MCN0150896.1 hypothetical protein [Salinispora arenicola]
MSTYSAGSANSSADAQDPERLNRESRSHARKPTSRVTGNLGRAVEGLTGVGDFAALHRTGSLLFYAALAASGETAVAVRDGLTVARDLPSHAWINAWA